MRCWKGDRNTAHPARPTVHEKQSKKRGKMKPKVLFTSEAVGEGHPDKICDQIADRVLDACLARDPLSRVACEVLAVGNKIVIAGEITCEPKISVDEIKDIARKTVRSIGYTTPESGISPDTMKIEVLIRPQSHDIAQGVDNSMDEKDIGAGDQGMMFGYATNETKNFMPLPYVMAQKIVRTAENLEKEGKLPHARPDMKSEVTIDYTNKNHPILNALVFSCQHDETIGENNVSIFREELKKSVLKPVVESFGLSLPEDDEIYINPTGLFVIGGPLGDTGLTGRKIIADTYGGSCPHGGGAFSGKDPTKVDRTGAYMARYTAKNIVAAGLADKCLVQVAYAIGVSKPVSILVETYHTEKVPVEKIIEAIINNEDLFDFTPRGMIKKFSLTKPSFKYGDISNYGHFGRPDLDLPWEKLDAVDYLKKFCGISK